MNTPESFREPNKGIQGMFQSEVPFDASALLSEAQRVGMDVEALLADINSGKEIDKTALDSARLNAKNTRDNLMAFEDAYNDFEERRVVTDLINLLSRFIEKTE